MIVCPNCNHQNPDGAVQCEACYTPLPATTSCPNCGAPVQTDASFCGQCGFSLQNKAEAEAEPQTAAPPTVAMTPSAPPVMPSLPAPDPLVEPDPLVVGSSPNPENLSVPSTVPPSPAPVTPVMASGNSAAPNQGTIAPTRIQQQKALLNHVQTKTNIELPQNLSIIHLGKPNEQIPPDIDVSGFPNSEVVSRIHADIRVEGDAYYIEDVGSSNGTYINHTPLPKGNRHRLRSGDRISLGKGDLVTFLFQLS
ncbi:FHA domain-containing protein [Aerosakkonemataceae cyanobacterium BLCC-F50]|uniref:FHA domain-containing protein n=1 Tax=Floridaenema flaviceps BLCC-F50 TaxID=3153642 RepID=A0ABV4XSF0_9CYAN